MRVLYVSPVFGVFLFVWAIYHWHPFLEREFAQQTSYQLSYGGIIRGDSTKKVLSIVFTGGDYGEGGEHILKVLRERNSKASFFFTGDFYRNPDFKEIIQQAKMDGHYLGAHSDKHLLYCPWSNRDSLLVNESEFLVDLRNNYLEMQKFGIEDADAPLFMPPYEWYNDNISRWTREAGLQLINYSPGTRSHADYTTPDMDAYQSSRQIWNSIINFEEKSASGLNGFILLMHIGTAKERKDKFYYKLDDLIDWLKDKGYELQTIDQLIEKG